MSRCELKYFTFSFINFSNESHITFSHQHMIKQQRYGVVVITTAQHSPKLEFRFCAGSNPARDVSEICDGKDLWQ